MRDFASNLPLVSVVIPTFRRPALVRRAVASVLRQSVGELEVIVVADGTDAAATDATRRALAGFEGDPRLRVLAPGRQLGNGGARNFGVDAARAPRVALLDDDDEWLPDKLEHQLPLAEGEATLVSCRLEARIGEDESHLWPRRRPRAGEPVGDYLFCPRRPGTGEGMIQTSTWLLSTTLLRRVRFSETLRRYVDLEWVLRAEATVPDFRVAFAGWPRPLCVWNIEPDRTRISNGDDGRFALDFAATHRALLTGRAYAGFVLSLASQSAAAAGRRPGYWKLLAAAYARGGRPSFAGLLGHALHFGVPRPLLRRVAGFVGRLPKDRRAEPFGEPATR